MRISKKVVLEYLESVYPTWKTFQQIVDEVPVMFNFDMFELEERLRKLYEERKIEKQRDDINTTQYFRFIKNKKQAKEK